MSQNSITATQPPQAGASGQQSTSSSSAPRPKGLPLHKIYELPAPIRTFPLPSFYPNNPISLFHVLYAWTKQTFFSPPAEPSVVYEGIWSPESKSVHVIDEKSMRALWQQGFYGKGNLSRSEPNWLKRERVRRGLVPGQVSELVTANRREERRQMKWERAKTEQEAIRQMRLQEAQQAAQEPAVDALKPSTDATPELSANGTTSEASAEPISLPESEPVPVNLAAVDAPNGVIQEATSNVTKDTLKNTPAAEPETASVNGVLKSGEVLPVSIPLNPAAPEWSPVGPSGLLSIPNTHSHELTNGESEAVSGSVDPVIARETVLQTNNLLPASSVQSLSAPIGPLELLRLPNSHIALPATDEQVASATQNSQQDLPPTLETAKETASTESQSLLVRTNGFTPLSYATIPSPVGPLELLSLPNSHIPLVNGTEVEASNGINIATIIASAGASQKLSTIPEDGSYDGSAKPMTGHLINDLVDSDKLVNGFGPNGAARATTVAATDAPETPKPLKRRKSVRFSPKVESATYESSDPPSPSFALLNGKGAPPLNGTTLGPSVLETDEIPSTTTATGDETSETEKENSPTPTEVVNKEHLQLTAEEAFFLSFGLGALRVVDPTSKAAIPTTELFNLFRQYSYFPSRPVDELQPDDGFLVNYAVYHHFRSLGWVPRAGIKFGVDWLLYAKGPVFDHAEFGAIILPSYSNQWWKDSDRELPRKTWHWLHGVVRVLSHVQKSLVLVYVDVPPPPQFDEAMKKGPAEVFKLYKIREVMVKRWSSNRNR